MNNLLIKPDRKASYRSTMTNKQKQSGIVMFVTLIALVIMLLASIALIRSTDTNLLIAGHLSFKRDLINQAERAMPVIKAQFQGTAALSTEAKRESDSATNNYYASILPSTNSISGIPDILLNVDTFDNLHSSKNISDANEQITIRYVIDRMCLQTGVVSAANCTLSLTTQDFGGTAVPGGVLPGVNLPVYRISMRVTGPRNTETYLQTSFRN